MAVSRAPKRNPNVSSGESKDTEEARIKEVIERGGSVANDRLVDSYEDEQKNVQLRLYQSMIAEIDEQRSQTKRGKRPSRHAWIISAIEEKLNRNNN